MQGYGAIRDKFLRVNLSAGTYEEFSLPLDYYKLYLGGKALGTRLMLDDKIYDVDPLSPENKVYFLNGPISGTMVPGAGKIVCLTKSPLTGIYLDSACGGRFSHNLKMSGYDGLVVEGRSAAPVILRIHNNEVLFDSASDIWGLGCFQAEKKLRERYGPEVSVGIIGPAGENQVAFASFSVDFYHQAGRGGLGAVLGSKNVKGIVISGDIPLNAYDQKGLEQFIGRVMEAGKQEPKVAQRIKYGTFSTVDLTHKLGMTPVKNFTEGIAPDYEEIKAESLRQKYVVKDLACYVCPMACGKASQFTYEGREYILGGPEYETIALLGSNLGIKNDDLFYLAWLCDELGVDSMSTGVIISCLMEGLDRGLISEEQTGIKLGWGDTKGAAMLIRMIASKEGIGAELAQGLKKYAAKYGLAEIAMEIKGLELAAYDPRGSTGYALELAVADRGGCHRRARPLYREMQNLESIHQYEGKPELIVELENERAFYHSLVICDFIPPMWPLKMKEYAAILKMLTGWEYRVDEVAMIGARAFLQNRMFNLRCGVTRKDDSLPRRFFTEALPEGPAAGRPIDVYNFQKMLDRYYELRGWDENGRPNADTAGALGLRGEDL